MHSNQSTQGGTALPTQLTSAPMYTCTAAILGDHGKTATLMSIACSPALFRLCRASGRSLRLAPGMPAPRRMQTATASQSPRSRNCLTLSRSPLAERSPKCSAPQNRNPWKLSRVRGLWRIPKHPSLEPHSIRSQRHAANPDRDQPATQPVVAISSRRIKASRHQRL